MVGPWPAFSGTLLAFPRFPDWRASVIDQDLPHYPRTHREESCDLPLAIFAFPFEREVGRKIYVTKQCVMQGFIWFLLFASIASYAARRALKACCRTSGLWGPAFTLNGR
jgi:hypothetical protein